MSGIDKNPEASGTVFKRPPYWKLAIAAVALPFSIVPFVVLTTWEVTEKPVRALIKRFTKTDWKKVGNVIALTGKDATNTKVGRAVGYLLERPIPKRIAQEVGKVGSEFGKSTSTFINTCRNSGPWGGFFGASLFFTGIVGLSVAATIVKVPLIAYYFTDLPQLTINGGTWLANHSPALLNYTAIMAANVLTAIPSVLSRAAFGVSLHIDHLSNFSMQPYQVAEHFPRLAKTLSALQPEWWDFEKVPYIGKYLVPIIGTQDTALDSAIKLAIGAKLIKPVVAPLYILFPQMKQHWPYKAATAVIHGLGHALMWSIHASAYPFKTGAALYRSTPLYGITSLGWKGMRIATNHALHAVGVTYGKVKEAFTSNGSGLPTRIKLAVHGYFLNKIQQVGGLDKMPDVKPHGSDRTYWGDISYAIKNVREVGRDFVCSTIASVPTLGTLGVTYAAWVTHSGTVHLAENLVSTGTAHITSSAATAAVLYGGMTATSYVRTNIVPTATAHTMNAAKAAINALTLRTPRKNGAAASSKSTDPSRREHHHAFIQQSYRPAVREHFKPRRQVIL